MNKGFLFKPLCVNSTFFTITWAQEVKDCVRCALFFPSRILTSSKSVCVALSMHTVYQHYYTHTSRPNFPLFLCLKKWTPSWKVHVLMTMPWQNTWAKHVCFCFFLFLLRTPAGYSNNGLQSATKEGLGGVNRAFVFKKQGHFLA